MRMSSLGVLAVLCASVGAPAVAAETAELLKAIRAVDHNGAGAEQARAAYAELVQSDRSSLTEILAALNGANPLASNYLRSAFEVIADAEQGDSPQAALLAFLGDRDNHPRARALAFEWIAKHDADLADNLLDGMLLDPSSELRRRSVQKRLDRAKELTAAGDADASKAAYQEALQGAIDEDQVQQIAQALKKSGEEVDLVRHFGLLTEWKIIGPFDNKDQKGFDVPYPPESELKFDAAYEGMKGEVRWQSIAAEDAMGKIDIAKQVAPHKGAVMYMYTEYEAREAGEVWFRLATPNAWKLWVNDDLAFARGEYHRGMRWDQYRVKVSLRQGNNRLLFKILQNEQTQDWAQTYALQFRVCDGEGVAILPVKKYQAALAPAPNPVAGK